MLQPRDILCFKESVGGAMGRYPGWELRSKVGCSFYFAGPSSCRAAFTAALVVRQSLSVVFRRRAVTRSTEGHCPRLEVSAQYDKLLCPAALSRVARLRFGSVDISSGSPHPLRDTFPQEPHSWQDSLWLRANRGGQKASVVLAHFLCHELVQQRVHAQYEILVLGGIEGEVVRLERVVLQLKELYVVVAQNLRQRFWRIEVRGGVTASRRRASDTLESPARVGIRSRWLVRTS